MTVLLDNATKSAMAVISGGGLNLAATDNNYNGARADTLKTAGLFVFEVTPTLVSLATDTGFGFTNDGTPPYDTIPGSSVGGLIIYKGGATWLNGVFLYNNVGLGGNTPIFAVNLTTHRAWILVTDAAGWNNDVTANPATGVGGTDISSIDGTGLYPVGFITSLANSAVFNFGASAFAHAKPTGYASWDTVTPPVIPPAARVNARMPAFAQAARATAQLGGVSSLTLASTEAHDVLAFTLGNTVGGTLAATEASDTLAATGAFGSVPGIVDIGEVIYGPPHENKIYVPTDELPLPFVIHSDGTMRALPFSGG